MVSERDPSSRCGSGMNQAKAGGLVIPRSHIEKGKDFLRITTNGLEPPTPSYKWYQSAGGPERPVKSDFAKQPDFFDVSDALVASVSQNSSSRGWF
ncbi:hypothetical protein ACLOJK_041317 [Asimina triloba]